jgi:hypothetical protein
MDGPLQEESSMKSFSEFKKRYHPFDPSAGFFACISPDGEWIDSAEQISTAMLWCMYNEIGNTEQDEEEWYNTKQHGYSIVHSSMLEKMYNAGLVK